MKKKIIIVSSIVLASILLVSLWFIFFSHKDKNSDRKDLSDVVSTITMDINPSFKIELDRQDLVFNVVALNDDANSIVEDDFKGKNISEVINSINNKLIEKEYIKDDVIILLNVEGEISKEKVKEMLNEDLKSKNKKLEIIEPEITQSAKKISEEYNISISKAAYIESIINDNKDIKIEDLKDKSINAIKNIQDEKITTTSIATTSVKETTSKKSTTKAVLSPPSDATDTSGIWCTFNKNKSPKSKFNYPEDIGVTKAVELAKAAINASSLGLKGTETPRIDDSRSSYCLSYRFMGYNDDNKYYVTIDSVTGKVIEQKVVPMDKPNITEEQAKSIGVNHFNIDSSSCDYVQAYFSMNNGKLKYTFGARCSGTYYTLNIDALNGNISGARTWQ